MSLIRPFHFARLMMLPAIAGFSLVQPLVAAPPAAPVAPDKEIQTSKPSPSVPGKETKTAPATKPAVPVKPAVPAPPPNAQDGDDDDAIAENAEAEAAAVAKPVSPDLVRVYGWREYIHVQGMEEKLKAKLDTGALTSSIHAEEKELFERDGKKWVRFIVTDPAMKKPVRTRVEAPLVRIAKVKEPGAESVPREVVRLSFQIGERKMRGEFTLNNRRNMLSPVLIGRTIIKDLGWVDPGRTYLADQKVMR